MPDRLRPLWDFGDLERTVQRFRDLLEHEYEGSDENEGSARAEVLTQLARVCARARGLDGRFGEGDQLLDEAETLQRCRCSSPPSSSRSRRAIHSSPPTRRTWRRSRRPTSTACSNGPDGRST